MKFCPCCGWSQDCDVWQALEMIHLTPNSRRILECLARRFGRVVAKEAIIDYLYGDDPNGGPDTADRCMSVFISRARAKLRQTGLRIDTVRCLGYRLVWNNAPTPTGWLPIETAPRPGKVVDLWVKGHHMSYRVPECYFSDGGWWRSLDHTAVLEKETHWISPPGPPETT